jgi:hypothetical protein
VVGEPVEQRPGEALGAEGLGPFVERQVAGDQGRAALVALGDQLEQQLGAGLANPSVNETGTGAESQEQRLESKAALRIQQGTGRHSCMNPKESRTCSDSCFETKFDCMHFAPVELVRYTRESAGQEARSGRNLPAAKAVWPGWGSTAAC